MCEGGGEIRVDVQGVAVGGARGGGETVERRQVHQGLPASGWQGAKVDASCKADMFRQRMSTLELPLDSLPHSLVVCSRVSDSGAYITRDTFQKFTERVPRLRNNTVCRCRV